ncbi:MULTISPECIES: Asp23/Gls24 family envelope stress response protein [Enterococcus]|uniref:Stress response regulator gls24 homolog n=1 Tax=Candidatus Enterococcus ferrettii TaxID=2815324 RepID=A0ABV0EVG9_9ENTE|nr:Asp23/Gls24 family envelope stress response protein [Enterococcus sp. 665A]MBO1338624.1 Asp23/Gls24 family envelope stress response protein [Enterococcus sp. 665A]
MENKTTMTNTQAAAGTTNVRGELTYEDKVIQKIIGIALENIDGLLTVDGGFFSNIKDKLVNSDDVTAGINTEVGKKQVAVDMDIVAEYGKDIEKIYDEMKGLIIEEVKKMTHLDVVEVNVNVVDIKTRAEYQDESETVQDKVSNAAESTGKFASRQTDKARNAMESEPRVQ